MSANSYFVMVGGTVFVVWSILYLTLGDSYRLQPDRRAIEVVEVDNGYMIRYRTANNPYPVREAVAKDSDEAAWQVKQYLGMPLPETRWGK